MTTKKAEDTQAAATQTEADAYKYWMDEIAQDTKRNEEFTKRARQVVSIYEADKVDANTYNILYANTETLLPAVYSQSPRPVVTRRYKDRDLLSGVASHVVQRLLEYFQDSNEESYEPFDSLMSNAVLAGLVPGRGVNFYKFDATIESTPGEKKGDKPTEKVTYDTVCGENVPWDRVRMGYAKQWKDLTWIGRDHYMTREESQKNFGSKPTDPGSLVQPTASERESDEGKEGSGLGTSAGAADTGGGQLILVHEIWNKVKREVIFISPGLPGKYLKRVDDPLKLNGFFPTPRPLQFVSKVKTLVPTPLYTLYEQQATELNKVSARIMKILDAIRVRGVYDARIGEIADVFDSADNGMVPAASMNNLDATTKLDNAIWFMPVDKLIVVLQQLYVQRDQIKKVIYELTGLADIVRGSSAASESATAQNIKDRWSSIRLKKMQREAARYARDSLRIVAEIQVTLLRPETIAQMTGIKLPTAQEKAAVQMKAQAQMPGQQPQPLSPEEQKTLESPTWDEVLGMLRNDKLRSYKIDIETNSTIDLDVTEDKKDIGEMMNAMGQFLNGVGGLVKEKAMPFGAAKAMLLAISQRFRFGREVEEELRSIVEPKQDDDQAAQVAQAQADMQLQQQKMQGDQQLAQAKLAADQQLAAQKLALDKEKMAADFAIAQQKLQQELVIAREKLALESQLAREKAIADHQLAEREAAQKRADARAERQLDAQLRREELAAGKGKPNATA